MYYENEEYNDLKYQNKKIEDINFVDCKFFNCKFTEIQIIRCSFVDCEFYNCSFLNMEFKYTDAVNNKFKSCIIFGINWSEIKRNKGAFQPFLLFENCTIKYNVFIDLNLKKFDFSSNNLIDSIFEQCKLQESKFCNCDLKNTTFDNNDLSKSDFLGSKNYLINIENNILKKAKFSFPDVINLLNSLDIEIKY